MTFSISNTLFQPPSVGECVYNVTHSPVFILLPTPSINTKQRLDDKSLKYYLRKFKIPGSQMDVLSVQHT